MPEDNRWLCGSPIAGRTNEPLPVDPVLGKLSKTFCSSLKWLLECLEIICS